MPEFPLPRLVGCVRCGEQWPRQHAVFAQCNACGKTCGVCRPCGRILGVGFLRDAMAWHQQQRHPYLFGPPADRMRGQRVVF